MTDDALPIIERMTLEELRDQGERIREHFRKSLGVELAYDRPTVEWLDWFIDRNRDKVTDEYRYGWSLAFGYILGESIRRDFGGEWEYRDEFGEWAVNLGDAVGTMNPIGKVWKYLREREDSVLSMYDVVGAVRERGWDNLGQRADAPAKEPWWRRLFPRREPDARDSR